MNETDLAANTDFQGSHGDPALALRILAEAGFRYLHWCHEWNSDHLYSDREIAEIAGVLKETGLRLLDIHGSDGAAHGFISCWYAENETFRKAGVECLNVFIHADDVHRAVRVSEITGCTNATELQKMLAKKDGSRHTYYTHYTGKKWGDSRNYHLTLDSGALGYERCVQLIVAAAAD